MFCSGTPEQELLDVIKRHSLHHSIHTDNNNNMQSISWASSEQLALLASFGEVLMMDATYKVNHFKMPLFTLAVVDANGHGQPVAHALVTREDEDHLKLFMEDVLKWEPKIHQATFITDKDLAEINAIKATCSEAKIFLCRFHIMKAFTEEIKRQRVDDPEALLMVCLLVYFYAGFLISLPP